MDLSATFLTIAFLTASLLTTAFCALRHSIATPPSLGRRLLIDGTGALARMGMSVQLSAAQNEIAPRRKPGALSLPAL
ncbi:hypothetical protein LAUMK191_01002 [Mycobacterium attenuatum]|uniref:Uncharacterized protein n=1 Tax=Mycobacterium attenuatum TaxID=2341086 RepID=A0A498PSG9_9MYCO|nr:hypothetical protein LAUMK136_01005 [Mycobacterium attenuatum]VBA47889.1 hypothetical protein LAUMK191_01002 [Mycobacterium attenuatum]VBA52029.1 hypothetical protein LAUMK41_01090 [Mycobacterium attenuatum]